MTPSTALLSLEQTPPLAVPLRFFLTAPLFGLAAALLALWIGPGHLGSRWQPGVLAFTHLLTLGYLAMVMFGALFQLLPVLVGVRLRWPLPTARVIHGLLVAGTLLLVTAFLRDTAGWFVAAGLVLGLAIGTFVAVIGHALWNACSVHDTVCAMKLSLTSLGVTLILGLWLVLGHVDSELGPRAVLIDLHLSWGLLGWAGLLLVGVAYQVVPMFQITAEYKPRLRHWLPWAVLLLLIVWSLAFLHLPRLAWVPGLGLAAVFAMFALVTLQLQRHRLRRLPDVTVDFWYLGLLCLLAAAGLWLVHQGWPQAMTAALFQLWWGVLVVVGAVVALISGMLYKIVPFLVWLHLNNRMQEAGRWQGNLPTMRQVIAERQARRHLYLHGAATVLLLPGLVWPWLFYPALLVLAGAFAAQWWNLLGAARTYRSLLRSAGL
ncbi:hypothetical protein [Sulfurivermis fontis]|uniref:hypothetical protein n=1 Tax=Sulfurivermis fontis TaxID=1972068 RepID=UPI000FD73CFA|nr:hypothetical protein [Sulfurivermis fontis]